MGTRRTILAVAAAILLCTSCGEETKVSGTPQRPAGSLDAALDTVEDLVDATVDKVLPDAATTPAPDNGAANACTDDEGVDTGSVQTQYGLYAEVPEGTDLPRLLQDVQAFWEAEGYEVDGGNVDSDPPALFIDSDGYNFQFLVNADGRAIVGGSTPCFEDES